MHGFIKVSSIPHSRHLYYIFWSFGQLLQSFTDTDSHGTGKDQSLSYKNFHVICAGRIKISWHSKYSSVSSKHMNTVYEWILYTPHTYRRSYKGCHMKIYINTQISIMWSAVCAQLLAGIVWKVYKVTRPIRFVLWGTLPSPRAKSGSISVNCIAIKLWSVLAVLKLHVMFSLNGRLTCLLCPLVITEQKTPGMFSFNVDNTKDQN